MNELIGLSMQEARERLLKGDLSARELFEAYRGRIAEKNPALNAYLSINEDAARDAEKLDALPQEARERMPLFGMPLAIKDNILIKGLPATAASKILREYRAAYDATVITRLREAGALFLGKTNLDEFAMGSSTEHSAFGPTKNPHDFSRVPGGSSGGSAAAVAGGLAIGALGSDTGGSIRQPAALSGVVGMKPTYGRVSRSGLIAMSSSLDQIGPFTRSVGDAEMLFSAIAGHDPLDATTIEPAEALPHPKPLRIGVPKEYFGEGLDPDVRDAVRHGLDAMTKEGAEVREISLPNAEYALAAYYVIMPSEVSANLARFDGIRYGTRAEGATNLLELYERTRGEGFGAEPRRRIMLGTFTLSHGYADAYYEQAEKVRRLIRDDFTRAFDTVDVVVGPTTPTPAFKIGEKSSDPLAMYLADIYTVAANLAGIPALSLPAGTVERDGTALPVGLQIAAPWMREDILFSSARAFEGVLPRVSFPFA